MSSCSTCNKEVKRHSGSQCDGDCRSWYHYKCAGVSEQAVLAARSSGRDKVWRCSVCAPARPRLLQPSGAPASRTPFATPEEHPASGPFSAFPVDFGNVLSKLQADVERVLLNQETLQKSLGQVQRVQEDLRHTIVGIEKALEHYGDQLADVQNDVKRQDARIAALEIDSSELKLLKSEVSKIQAQRDDFEQAAVAELVEIKGIPEATGDLVEAVVAISRAIGCPVQASDVLEVRRVPSRRPRKEVAVKFRSAETRGRFVECARRRRPLTASGAGLQATLDDPAGDTLYVNEMLTPRKKLLLSCANKFAKENKIQFVWVRNGQILMRKSAEIKEYVVIKQERDLTTLFRR